MTETDSPPEPSTPSDEQKSRRGLILKLAAVCGLAVIGLLAPVAWRGRAATATFDLGHAPTFAVLAVVSLVVLTKLAGPLSRKTFLIVAALLILSGGGLEYMQRFFRRSPSWGDAFANTVGVACGLAWFIGSTKSGPSKWLLRLGAVAGIVAVCFQPARIVFDCYRLQRDFPLISSFEDHLELSRWNVRKGSLEISTTFQTAGVASLEWNLTPGKYPRISHSDPANWTGYSALEFDMLLTESNFETQKLMVKVFDIPHKFDYHDRFHQEIELPLGKAKSFRIDLENVRNAPANREMDMTQIYVLEFYAIDQTHDAQICVDNLRLVK